MKYWVKGYWDEFPKLSWRIIDIVVSGGYAIINGKETVQYLPPIIKPIRKFRIGEQVRVKTSGKIYTIKGYSPSIYHEDKYLTDKGWYIGKFLESVDPRWSRK